MHYAVIAAGEGSRLSDEGIMSPKPLIPINGRPMIGRLLDILQAEGAESLSVICNPDRPEVAAWLEEYRHQAICPMQVLMQRTPSSMHSLAVLSKVIPTGRVCITTVDTIFLPTEFHRFVEHCNQVPEGQGIFAVTPYVEDEKPLWVATEGTQILGFYDQEGQMPLQAPRLVSGGIYCLDTQTAFPVLHQSIEAGQHRMRNYQRALIKEGVRLEAFVFDKILDIDHAADIAQAQRWLAKKTALLIGRDEAYSPNNIEKDAAILSAVSQQLEAAGWQTSHISERQLQHTPFSQLQAYDMILHQARHLASLVRLERLSGVRVINSPSGVQNTAKSRELTLMLLEQAGIDVPQWWAYEPEEDALFQCEPRLQQLLPGWVKAMHESGVSAHDVCYVETPLEADTAILEQVMSQSTDIVVTKHQQGDLLKCYYVAPDFIRSFYPQDCGYSKFGEAEQHNGAPRHLPVGQSQLLSLAQTVAQALGLEVFGLDLIVSDLQGQATGTESKTNFRLTVIDVNDWPSFSVCREEAARAIAKLAE